MKKLAAVGRADLLRDLLDPSGATEGIAPLLGYERKPKAETNIQTNDGEQSSKNGGDSEPDPPPQPPKPRTEFPVKRPPLQFLMPTEAETLIPDPPKLPVGNPITDAELSVPWKERGLPLRPLVPWARLGMYLKKRLGVSVAGRRLDDRKLMRLAATGLPLTVLPRQMRAAWASQVVILRDDTAEMYPFSTDADALCRRLKRERGSSGLKIVSLRNLPATRAIRRIPFGTSILAVSSMGQLTDNTSAQQAWERLARSLAFRRHSFSALNPAPRNRWTRELADSWPMALWDRNTRLPRRGGLKAVPKSHGSASMAEHLLTLLSPATLIEPALLRHVRTLLGRTADAGDEWDAWHHKDCWQSLNCIGLRIGDAWDNRLSNRAEFAKSHPVLIGAIDAAIREQHKTCCEVIAAEAELRAILSGVMNAATLSRIQHLLKRVVDRLRLLARETGSDEGGQSGLPKWFADMVQRLSPKIRQQPAVAEAIAQGLALAHTWLNTGTIEVPLGVNAEHFASESRAAATRIVRGSEPIDCRLAFDGDTLELRHDKAVQRGHFSLAAFRVPGTGRFTAKVEAETSQQFAFRSNARVPAVLAVSSNVAKIEFESPYSRLQFAMGPRPPWASRMWYDGFGVAAEFLIGDVPLVMRWIPPGRFQMGSYKSELGRRSNEGPVHEVAITRGFWLTETPITQRQWWAGMELSQNAPPHVSAQIRRVYPTGFRRPKKLSDVAVEWLSWDQCRIMCGVWDWIVSSGAAGSVATKLAIKFSLPTEAEWEYACRAGTSTAFNDGIRHDQPTELDDALARLGWFDRNTNDRPHPVKAKLPNSWGLYDMHGAVWEWCEDPWDEHAYKSRQGVCVNPHVVNSKNADIRVVRGGSRTSNAKNCRSAFRYHYQRKFGRATGVSPTRHARCIEERRPIRV